MAVLSEVSIHNIRPNPYRGLDKYPYNEKKLTALQASIKDVGFWAGVIARPKDNHYELAFGHHRLEAAKCCGLEKIPLLIQALSDLEMLKYMARENMEDYNTDFLTLLGTWEAGDQYVQVAEISAKNKALEIAKTLGWTRLRSEKGRKDRHVLNDVADACNKAYTLIQGGHLSRADLQGQSVFAVREICSALVSRLDHLELAKANRHNTGYHLAHIEKAIDVVAKATKWVARDVREGNVVTKKIRGQIESEAYDMARAEKPKPEVLFDAFAHRLANHIEEMLRKDSAAEKLKAVVKSLGQLTQEKDVQAVKRLDYELGELENAARRWRKKLATVQKKASRQERATVPALPQGH